MTAFNFALQFEPSEIVGLASRYSYPDGDAAFKAGKRIVEGDYSRDNLKAIIRWKSARRISLIDRNTDSDIAQALRVAADSRAPDRSAVEGLDRLRGVGIPVASAILTTISPMRFTIIDFRALESLGVHKWPTTSIDYYLDYLEKCRELSRKYQVSLRTLDRALWQWSKERNRRLIFDRFHLRGSKLTSAA